MTPRSKILYPSRAKNSLKQYSSAIQKLKEGKYIYRGLGNFNKRYAIVRPSKFSRQSRNTKNIYTALMDFLPAWSDYPKRSKSIICSTSRVYARGYTSGWSDDIGALYVVLPKNGASIGICPDYDIWNSFGKVKRRWQTMHMGHFNELFEELFYKLFESAGMVIRNEMEYMNSQEMESMLKEADLVSSNFEEIEETTLAYLEGDREFESMTMDIRKFKIDEGITWTEYFNELMSPDENEFSLQTIETFDSNLYDNSYEDHEDHEVWTDSNCILSRITEYIGSKKSGNLNNSALIDLIDRGNEEEIEVK